jgi:hypothetical protein
MGMRARAGYVLLEAIGALAVLSVGIFGVHQAMRQAILTRGQARDYTQARFLLEDVMGELTLRPVLQLESRSGAGEDDLARFNWRYTVSKVDLPEGSYRPPASPDDVYIPTAFRPRPPVRYLGRISVTVTWTRQGRPFDATAETLVPGERLYVPEEL